MLKLLLIGLTLVHSLPEQCDEKPAFIAECHYKPVRLPSGYG